MGKAFSSGYWCFSKVSFMFLKVTCKLVLRTWACLGKSEASVGKEGDINALM